MILVEALDDFRTREKLALKSLFGGVPALRGLVQESGQEVQNFRIQLGTLRFIKHFPHKFFVKVVLTFNPERQGSNNERIGNDS